jgi:hypothetical protein
VNKRKKEKCPHPQCQAGFVYTFKDLPECDDKAERGVLPAVEIARSLCPTCKGLGQVRRKR